MAIADRRAGFSNTACDSVPGRCESAVDAVECAVKSGGRYSALADDLQSGKAPMPVDPRHNSRKLLEGPDRVVARAMMKAVGFTDESLARPQIGIAHCYHAVQLEP